MFNSRIFHPWIELLKEQEIFTYTARAGMRLKELNNWKTNPSTREVDLPWKNAHLEKKEKPSPREMIFHSTNVQIGKSVFRVYSLGYRNLCTSFTNMITKLRRIGTVALVFDQGRRTCDARGPARMTILSAGVSNSSRDV